MAKRDAVEGRPTTDVHPVDGHTGGGGNGIGRRSAVEPLPDGQMLGRRSPHEYGVWLIVIGVVLATILTLVLIGLPGVRPAPEGSALPDNELTRIIGSVQGLLAPSNTSLPVVLGKLLLAALLGGIIGYRQRIHVEEYIVEAHVIISFTGALMMIIIGNEIVRAFGLLGAGSIIRYRTPVRDPKALASLFVTMGVGIAVGVGLFELALVAGVLIVLLQGVMATIASGLPRTLYNPQRAYALTLQTEDGGGTIMRLKEAFEANDIRYRLTEYDLRAGKKDNLTKIVMSVEAGSHMTTEQLTLLVLEEGVQSVSWEEESAS